ncbi:hypothetical protein PLANPX_3029 [Lacipirellula parvula]|uniref:Uncharacterized protein n=1 Tax=Lacipirellula parvula TaxID=2650471 RepID=A0A5K7XBL0_9BACT|nr:hypothetical protein PLANPX_3029 [Lacipirellula parvula]
MTCGNSANTSKVESRKQFALTEAPIALRRNLIKWRRRHLFTSEKT